tara:strand:- start:721 stop:1008 length:288 start_codon:yes stop_codon:yes gene_type:complete
LRTDKTRHRGTKWFRFLDAAAYELGRAREALPAARIYERVEESGRVHSRFMPKKKQTTAQLFRFDDMRRFRKVGSYGGKWTTYGLRGTRYPEDDE